MAKHYWRNRRDAVHARELANYQAEKERKETVAAEAKRLDEEKQEQKRKRREEKERAKKAAEREALRVEIDEKFIEPGETRVPIAEQEVVEIDGLGDKGK